MRVKKSQVAAYSTLPWHGGVYIPGCKIAWALPVVSAIEDAVPLIHGPVGCSFQRKLSTHRYYSLFYEAPCTNMDDTNVVFGGEAALRAAIVDTYEKYHPNLIVVITTCPSDLIGDDVGAVVREVKRHTEVECEVVCSTGNFVGKARSVGHPDIFYAILDQLLTTDRNIEKVEDSVNLVSYPTIQFEDIRLPEFASVLKEMGIKINKIIFDHTRVKDFYELPRAELNIMGPPRVWREVMERRWGVESFVISPSHKYKDPEMISPYGIEGSAKIFMDIAKKLGKDGEGEEVVRKLKGEAEQKLSKLKNGIEGRKIAIDGGFMHGHGLVEVKDLGMKVSALIYQTQFEQQHYRISEEAVKEKIELDVEVAHKYGSDPLVLVNPSLEEKIKALKKVGTELVICNDTFNVPMMYGIAGLKTFNHGWGFDGYIMERVGFKYPIDLCIQIKEVLENFPKKSPLLGLLEYDPHSPSLTPHWAKLQDLFGVTSEGSKGGEMRL